MKKERKVYSGDIHIHTPASKCYKGNKNSDEYIAILKTAKKKKLDIIAISDHNSIEGFSELKNQKIIIENEIEALNRLSDSKQALKELKVLNSRLKLFRDILILPAVEFEVNNGIHLLVIFNPETSISIIRQFLVKGGYNSDDFGIEKSETIAKWSIFDLYDEVRNYDCLIIDGHTDSNKGILNTIPNGNSRAYMFKNKSLNGVCYKNETQRKKLETTLKNSTEYYRETALAFLKSSDAHNLNEIGEVKSYFKLKNLSWKSFKEAFTNPIEYIFTNFPKSQDIINNIIRNESSLSIAEMNKDNFHPYCESICALNNTEGGYIIFGIDEKKTIIGLDLPKDKTEFMENYFTFIIDGIKKIGTDIEYDFNMYKIQEEKVIIIIKIFKGDRFVDIGGGGIIYEYINGVVAISSAAKIQKKIEDNTVKIIENMLEKSLVEIDKQTSIIKTSVMSLPVISSYIEKSISIYDAIDNPKIIESLELDIQRKEELLNYADNNGNGKSKGNIFFFDREQAPRLRHAYLRVSIPKYFLKDYSSNLKNNESIYVIPGGGVYYSKKSIEHFNPKGFPIIQLNTDKKSGYSVKFICAFLKSSFFLWFLITKYDNLDLYIPSIFEKIRLPILNFNNPKVKELLVKIETEIDEILQKELIFLKIKITKKNYEKEIIEHNSSIDFHSYEIDRIIYGLLELNSDEIELIEKTLNANQVYLPGNRKL